MSRKRKNLLKNPQSTPISALSPAASSSLPQPSSRTRLLHLSILILLSIALYAPTLRNEFVTDDKLQILQNPLVLQGKNLGEAFTGDVWDFAHKNKENAANGSNYYRPLQLLVYTAEYAAFGDHPFGWHLVNVLLNAVVIALIYLLVAFLVKPSLAFWTSLWFTLHPLHTEPVAWVAALPELQCALFLFLAMLCYHRARSVSSPLRLLLSSLFFLAALFSKETALLFPGVLLCYEFLYSEIRPLALRPLAARLSPFLVVLAGYLFARTSALGGFSPHPNTDRPVLSLGQLFFAVPAVFARYVGKLFVPSHLNYFYAFPMTTTLTVWAMAGFLLAVLLVAGVFYFRNTRPDLSFALCWFALTLAPAFSLNSLGINFFTERYLYIPSFGFSILAASLTLAIFSWVPAPVPRRALAAALLSLFVFYVVQVERRIAVFHDNYTLLSDAVRDSPDSYAAQGQLAAAYYDRGELDQAIQHTLRALQLNPSYIIGHINAAWYLTDKKDYDSAIPHLKEATRLRSTYLIPWINLAKVYTLQQNWQLAADTYRHAATLDPGQSVYFLQLASLAEANEKSASAAAAPQSSANPDPRDFYALVHFGDAASQAGQWQRAAQAFERASALHPENATILDKWGISLLRAGDPAHAAEVLQRALNLQPDSLFIRQALAGALAGSNHLADSTAQLRKILEMKPTWEHADQVHLALAVNAEKSGDRSTAVQEYQRALALNPSLDFATKRLAALK